jgi:mono/diheme cytochrome c family protein
MPRTLALLFLLLSGGGSLLAQQLPIGPNLLENPGFEVIDGKSSPRSWHPSTWGGSADFKVEAAGGRGGSTCLAIHAKTGANVSWSQSVTVETDTDYLFRAWVRLSGVEKSAGYGVLINPHELGLRGKSEGFIGDRDWFPIETRFNSGSRTKLLFNLTFGGWGSATGVARFDDVELFALREAPPAVSPAEAEAQFRKSVFPLLREQCFACHGPSSELAGGLFLGRREGLLRGGDSGPAIDLERPRKSTLLAALRHETFEMPPDRQLPEAEIESILLWIRSGAPFPEDLAAPRPASEGKGDDAGIDIGKARAEHWAFQALGAPTPPMSARSGAHPIDAFIDAELKARGLRASPPADPRRLVRRLAYDLTGLPPTAEIVEAFAAEPSDEAWANLIDHYLASPHYGEKWARHWLDLVRYAETNSFERDSRKPFVWRYRDRIIRAFQDDQPYDEFILHQLAGDEIEPPSRESLIATGYYRLGAWDDEPADPDLARYDELDDIIATTSQTFLGLTVNCARCHDHKIDPIPQRDYYSMLAFFRGLRPYGIRSHESVEKNSLRVIASDEDRRRFRNENRLYKAELAALKVRLEKIEAKAKAGFTPVQHEDFRNESRRVDLVETQVAKTISAEEFEGYQRTSREYRERRRKPPAGLAQALVVSENGSQPKPTHLLIRGLPAVKGPQVEPRFLEVLGGDSPGEISARDGGRSSGRRLALARWIASPDNPLTARVFVNRIWQHHFGRGIVATSSDFGLQGSRPSHPQLLDWLARRFIEGGWRSKPLHRLILTSKAWRRSVVPVDAATREGDPDAVWLSRARMRRLTGEELRDSILSLNGRLNLEAFGPSIHPPISKAVLAGQSRPGAGWPVSPPGERDRRSIYVHVKRSMLLPILAAHDAADTDFSCPVRHESMQPTQALSLMNGDFLHEQAQAFAEEITRSCDGTEARLRAILARATQAPPTAEAVVRIRTFHREMREDDGLSEAEALTACCLLAYNLNEFAFLD